MSSAHVAVPSLPQNHPKAQKAAYLFYGMQGGWGPRAKAPASAVCMGKAKNTAGVQLFTSVYSSRELPVLLRGWGWGQGAPPHSFLCWFQAQA